MTKMKHTKGPWKATTGPNLLGNVWTESNFRVADCLENDAHLIAAAPDMLMQLESLVNTWDFAKSKGYKWEMDQDGIEIVRELITKAKGESK